MTEISIMFLNNTDLRHERPIGSLNPVMNHGLQDLSITTSHNIKDKTDNN